MPAARYPGTVRSSNGPGTRPMSAASETSPDVVPSRNRQGKEVTSKELGLPNPPAVGATVSSHRRPNFVLLA